MGKFLCSVADVYAYDTSDNLLFEGKTMLDTSVEATVGNTDVRGGKGNQLEFTYYHTSELTGTVTNIQWSLEQMALNVGSTIGTGSNIWTTETVAVTSGAGTITGTPIVFQATTLYAWVTYGDVVSERVTVNGSKQFTIADTTYTGNVCVRYYEYSSSTRYLNVNANIIPTVFRLVMIADLYTQEEATTVAGQLIVTVQKAQATGAFTMSMTADGVANTPLSYKALRSVGTIAGCATGTPVYAVIQENIYDTHWYDDVIALAFVGGAFALADSATTMPEIRAIPATGDAFRPPYADLTFAATGGTTVDNTTAATRGTITGGATPGTVTVTITAATSIDVTVAVTVAT